jgi:PAS domain S-box-containing protein
MLKNRIMFNSPLRFIPIPALLVRKNNFEIIEGNSPAAALTGLGIEKLQGTDGSGFFPEIQIIPGKFEDVLFRVDSDHQFPVKLSVESFDVGTQPGYILSFQKKEFHFKDLMDSALDGIIITDKKLNVLEVNDAFCAIAELKREDLTGANGFKLARNLLSDEALDSVLPALQSMVDGHSVSQFEIVYRGKALGISARITKKAPTCFIVVRDISRERNAQKALQESEEKFRFFAESTFEGIVVHNRGIVLNANESFLNMTGHTHEEAIGKNLLDYIPKASDKARVVASMMKRKSKPYHVGAIKKDGSPFIVEIESKEVNYLDKKVRISAIRDVTKQIKLQEKLKESEQRYRTVFEKTGTATVIIEKDRIISLANSRFADLVGFPIVDLENKMNWVDFVYSEDLEKLENWHELRRSSPEKVSNDYEFRLVDRYHNIKYINLFLDMIPGSEQSIASLIDITERKKAEEMIQESESRLKKAQSIAKLGSWTINMETRQATGSDEAMHIYGLYGQNITLDMIQKVPLPEYREMLDKTLDDLVTGKNNYDVEFRLLNQNSGQIIDVRSMAEYNPDEKIVTGVIQDVTRMKQAEILIQQREQYLQSIFRAAPVGIGVVVDRIITGVNEKLCKLTGYSEEELLNQSSRMLYLSESDFEYVGEVKYNEIYKTGTGTVETRWRCKNGTIMEVLLSSTPIDTSDFSKGVTFTAMDITERKRAEHDLISKNQELILAKNRAEESDRLKTAFLANMSHEIRTPMNGILGFTSLLENPSLSTETMQGYIDIIKKSGERLLGTVNDLIDISKLETGQVSVVNDDTYINELMDNLHNFFFPETSAKGLQLHCQKSVSDQYLTIQTDEQKLHSVLTNLVKNAIKYTKQGSVEFGYREIRKGNNAMLEFYIKDTGIGIPKERQQAVFNRFEQADIEDRHAYEGSGLGLAIAKTLVEMLGGEIWLESTVDVGSTFYFTIPFVAPEFRKSVTAQTKPVSKSSDFKGNMKILIAEDDEISFRHLSILLKELTGELLHVSSGTEVVKICRENPDIDLVLMDIKMPGMNGLEATRRIREFNTEIPIIAHTAYALAGDREKALEAGCNDYISKPILEEELMRKLGSYMV